ncbi:MAG: hypothetical protein K2Q15_05310 [Burkholderiales bacterium]|jgi:hypothetical protein|nr:hypothetical protein [Burkholderiales bacterium]
MNQAKITPPAVQKGSASPVVETPQMEEQALTKLSVRLPKQDHQRYKMLALVLDMSLQDMAALSLKEFADRKKQAP